MKEPTEDIWTKYVQALTGHLMSFAFVPTEKREAILQATKSDYLKHSFEVSENALSHLKILLYDHITVQLELYRQGSTAYLYELYRRYVERIISHQVRYIDWANKDDCNDIGQEVWIKVELAAPRFIPEARFSTWLFIVIRNTAINFFKKRFHSKEGDEAGGSLDDTPRNKDLEPDARIQRIIAIAVEVCYPWCFLVFFYNRLLGWKPADIALKKSATKLMLLAADIEKSYATCDLTNEFVALRKKMEKKLNQTIKEKDRVNQKRLAEYLELVVGTTFLAMYYGERGNNIEDEASIISHWSHSVLEDTKQKFVMRGLVMK